MTLAYAQFDQFVRSDVFAFERKSVYLQHVKIRAERKHRAIKHNETSWLITADAHVSASQSKLSALYQYRMWPSFQPLFLFLGFFPALQNRPWCCSVASPNHVWRGQKLKRCGWHVREGRPTNHGLWTADLISHPSAFQRHCGFEDTEPAAFVPWGAYKETKSISTLVSCDTAMQASSSLFKTCCIIHLSQQQTCGQSSWSSSNIPTS